MLYECVSYTIAKISFTHCYWHEKQYVSSIDKNVALINRMITILYVAVLKLPTFSVGKTVDNPVNMA